MALTLPLSSLCTRITSSDLPFPLQQPLEPTVLLSEEWLSGLVAHACDLREVYTCQRHSRLRFSPISRLRGPAWPPRGLSLRQQVV